MQISPEDPEVMEQYCEFMEEYLKPGDFWKNR